MSVMQRTEIPNNSDEQVIEYVSKARALADQLNLTPEQWVAVFQQACQLYAGKQIMLEQPQPVDLSQLARSNGLR